MPYRVGAKGSYGCSGYPALKEDTNEVMGCHETRAQAAAQIYAINQNEGKIGKSMVILKEGDYAMTQHGGEGDFHIGQVVHVMTEGSLGNPETEYYMEASAENPAVMIQLFEQEEDGYWEATRLYTACAMSLYVKIDPLQTEPEMNSEVQMAMYDSSIGKAKKPNYEDMLDRPGDSKPSNMDLYNRIKQEARTKFDVYPSAVANAWVVAEYKRRGGTYKSSDSMTTTKSLWGGKFDPRG
jgi:hypothetical protein